MGLQNTPLFTHTLLQRDCSAVVPSEPLASSGVSSSVCVCVYLIALAVVLQAEGAFAVAASAVPTFDLSRLPTSQLGLEGVAVATQIALQDDNNVTMSPAEHACAAGPVSNCLVTHKTRDTARGAGCYRGDGC